MADPQECYDFIAKETAAAQVNLADLFWCEDEELLAKERQNRATKSRPLSENWETPGS